MPKIKTKKSVTKRFKITKNGKIFRRATGLNHFRAKKTGNQVRKGRKMVRLSDSEFRAINKFLKI
ncbi:MAG: 50S ribosomal protein L35 [Candidatus Nealsonbacteria bacterium]|nr:50S ribosomal protein L35 [Candidatus Nealsonbacteria bacterium]